MRQSHRTALGPHRLPALAITLLAAVGSATVSASAQGFDKPDSIATAAPVSTIVGNGLAIEAALDQVGLGDAWREDTALSDRSRHMLVVYPNATTRSAVTTLVSVVADLERANALKASINSAVRNSTALLELTMANETRLENTVARGGDQLDSIIGLIQSVAIDIYSNHGAKSEEAEAISQPSLLLTRRSDELASTALERLVSMRDSLTDDLHSARESLPDARQARAAAFLTHQRVSESARHLPEKIADLQARASELLPEAAEAFLSAEIVGEPGLSLRALDAYFNAEEWMTDSQPGCGITWQTIGAIGLVESRHGTHAGNRLLTDGRTQYQIIGATLDGSTVDNFGEAVSVVTDTDGGAYDGDPLHDRAVGPMQFIPETWRQWSVDADGDGRRDPNDMDDAAVATARYLCANGQIKSKAAWDAAVYTYNQSRSYVDSIRSAYHHLDDTVEDATVESLDIPVASDQPDINP